ncbi:M3 family oligoendopeptidase [Candidatus Collierbacteria bacterium]|nr:M3 family oligoendopeptidase [Candidatus Collierbacteria bacterium]
MALKNTHWNLNQLFKSDTDPAIDQELEKIRKETHAFVAAWKNRRDYLSDPSVLKQALDQYSSWQEKSGTDGAVGYYFSLKNQLNQNDPSLKARLSKVRDFAVKLQNDIQFFELALSKVSKTNQLKFLKHSALVPYHHFLERLFAQGRHLLTDKEEKILNLKSITSYTNWVKMLSSFISSEERLVLTTPTKKEKMSFSEILSLLTHTTPVVRHNAARVFNRILKDHLLVAENELNSVLTDKKVNDELRHHHRPDSARHLLDDIDTEVVDSLVKSVSGRFDLSRRYYQLKAKLFKLPKLKYHERNLEYGRLTKKYSLSQSVNLINRTLEDLDPQFAQIFSSYLENGQIDVFPKKNKREGAFCIWWLKSLPTFILLNHTNQLRDVLTLAHELGHAINSELMRQQQNSLNFHSPLSVTEVASTFLEDFVLRQLLQNVDEETRLALMMSKLNDDVSTIFRQIALYRFEQELHQNHRASGYLSCRQIGKLFQKHMASYMGPAVEQSPGSENWWVYWNHIRTYFYVYSYANGLLISKSLQNLYHSDPSSISKIKDFFSAGSSSSPKQIFLKLGLDISNPTFWQSGLQETEDLLGQTEALARRLGKIQD